MGVSPAKHAKGWLSPTSFEILQRGVNLVDLTDGPGVNFLGMTPFSPNAKWLEFDQAIEKFQQALDDDDPIFPFLKLTDKEKQFLGAVYVSSDWAEDQFQMAMMKKPTARQLALFRLKHAVQAIERKLTRFEVPFTPSSYNKPTDLMGNL
tara:strand:+ start:1200 stop:1649 length:450 start_codon:yes stop_codon:yes gene_type:complete